MITKEPKNSYLEISFYNKIGHTNAMYDTGGFHALNTLLTNLIHHHSQNYDDVIGTADNIISTFKSWLIAKNSPKYKAYSCQVNYDLEFADRFFKQMRNNHRKGMLDLEERYLYRVLKAVMKHTTMYFA